MPLYSGGSAGGGDKRPHQSPTTMSLPEPPTAGLLRASFAPKCIGFRVQGLSLGFRVEYTLGSELVIRGAGSNVCMCGTMPLKSHV